MKIKVICIMLSLLFLPACNQKTDMKDRESFVVELSRPFTFVESCNTQDPLLQEILRKDMKGKKNPLELIHHYAEILNKGKSHGKTGKKLDTLFLCGRPPVDMDGYYHGITISLKTGLDIYTVVEDARRKLGIGEELDILQTLYGRVFSKTSPWAGKNFKKIDRKRLDELTGSFKNSKETTYLGINSFRKENKNIVNKLSNYLLSAVIDMDSLPKPERKQRSWIHAKGGLFIAQKAFSVDPEHPEKEVIALNYRWESLSNRLPNRLLVDEIVEISKGLYLGKLYYATAPKYLFEKYSPEVQAKDYKYRNFGYFVLMDDTWLHEKNKLFPELTYTIADDLHEKFTTFTFIESPEGKAVQEALGGRPTILHYLQDIYEGIQKGDFFKDKYFDELHKIFMCGERPDGINGFLHGGVVSFKNAGFLTKFDRSVLNDLYPAIRPFSPWSGKTFTSTTVDDIKTYIGDNARYYEGIEPIILGANTYRKDIDLSLPATAFIEHLDKIGMVVEYPDEEEKRKEIYVKSFYFIAANGKSFNPENREKELLQFNYRWPEFHTMPPDHLCFDEIVRIADGLYLGQLVYSTRPEIPYDPGTDDALYKYENFGYFMLMDDDWHAVKDFILFDTDK
ncbi:MAG: hypothetical protein HF982_13730 [Desulfobacteraceae bacterium]|nr:hypothetical protein [Desulfobacteraceae bacterium]MBC2720619.1 hypothetical protein [Desulfobacteraceae bacterium]